jgi:hypothetical protein
MHETCCKIKLLPVPSGRVLRFALVHIPSHQNVNFDPRRCPLCLCGESERTIIGIIITSNSSSNVGSSARGYKMCANLPTSDRV